MISSACMFLMGAMYIPYWVMAAEQTYVAEMLVEAHINLDKNTILSLLNTSLQVNDSHGHPYTVTFLESEVTSECFLTDGHFNCKCSSGFIWTNDVCYNYGCCSGMTCTINVIDIIPLCVPKVEVYIHVEATLTSSTWSPDIVTKVKNELARLNGFESMANTGYSVDGTTADFEAVLRSPIETSRLQDIVTTLETHLDAVIYVSIKDMVNIEHPQSKVPYDSIPTLKCTFELDSNQSVWNFIKQNQSFELYNGSVVKLNQSCATEEYRSCVALTLEGVTSAWAGLYECGFIFGSIRFTSETELKVALLPEDIHMEFNPPTVHCLDTSDVISDIIVIIANSSEPYEVSWQSSVLELSEMPSRFEGDHVVYSALAKIKCQKTSEVQSATIIFKNSKGQLRTWQKEIPVIYVGEGFCRAVNENENWPATPNGNTMVNEACTPGTVGYRSRTCENGVWQPVYDYCANKALNDILKDAERYEMGLRTQDSALDVFKKLGNVSFLSPNPSEVTADVTASIEILNIMATASKVTGLNETVLKDFVATTSNILNTIWTPVNTSVLQKMASVFLNSTENLIRNIKLDKIRNISDQITDVKACTGSGCATSVFDISVKLNSNNTQLKTMAVKNLMNKLKNNFKKSSPLSDTIVIATTEDSMNPSDYITLEFVHEHNDAQAYCVFWDTNKLDWSDTGCSAKSSPDNRTICVCNHLTSFSVLMAKGRDPNPILDVITTVGLAVSLCSLLVYLTIEALVWPAVVKSNLSHFRHTSLVNIATFRMLADICFLASSSPDILSDDWCLIMTIGKHLFYLTMFSWMLCMSVMLVHQLIFVFSPLRKRVFMFLSSIVGYICPILIVGFSYLHCQYTKENYYDRDSCWLVFNGLLDGSLHAFLIPVGTITFTNLFSMIVVIVTLLKTSVPDDSKANDKDTAKSIFKVIIFLAPVFGITWGIGFLLQMLNVDNPVYVLAEYTFVILNSFQGFFILITGSLTEQKSREELMRLIKGKRGLSNSTKDSMSTTHTKQ